MKHELKPYLLNNVTLYTFPDVHSSISSRVKRCSVSDCFTLSTSWLRCKVEEYFKMDLEEFLVSYTWADSEIVLRFAEADSKAFLTEAI